MPALPRLFALSLAPTATYMLDQALLAVNLHYASRAIPDYSSILALSSLLLTVSGSALATNLDLAFITFAGRAFRANPPLLPRFLQMQAMSVLLSIAAQALLVPLFGASLLQLFGQSPELAREAARYSLLQLPAAILYLSGHLIRCFLNAQGVYWPVTFCSISALCSHLLISTQLGEWEYYGPVVCNLLTYFLNLVLLLLALYHKGLLLLFTRVFYVEYSIREYWAYLKETLLQGLPGLLDRYYNEVVLSMAALLGPQALQTHFVLANMFTLLYYFDLGVACSTIAFAANYIGENSVPKFKELVRYSITAASIYALIFILALSIHPLQNLILSFYLPPQSPLIAKASEVITYFKWVLVLDYQQLIMTKILKAMGQAWLVLRFMLLGAYPIGLIAGLLLRESWGLGGVWAGQGTMIITEWLLMAVGLILVVRRKGLEALVREKHKEMKQWIVAN